MYIGEGEDIGDRIKSHDTKKDWWTIAMLITSAANNLNKAHVKYLESRLVEAARANMENFLEYILMVLPALRIDSFLANTRPKSPARISPLDSSAESAPPTFILNTPKHGIEATAVLENGEFVVLAGSKVSYRWKGKGTEETGYARLFAELVKTGVLAEHGSGRMFTDNYAFKSPSAAAAVVNGRPANGTIEWKLISGKTYKEWEQEKLAQEVSTNE